MSMRILTDCPQELAPFISDWKQASTAGLPAAERAVWAALNPSAEPVTSTTPGPLPLLVAVGHAPRSQFAALLESLKSGVELPHGLAAVALQGQDFKGQRERSWQALKGNLHLCVYYRINTDAARLGIGLTVLPAVAAAAAIRRATGGALQPGIKWVNDVLIDGQKVSGVLTATQASRTTIEHVIFGIGINVAVIPAIAPTPFVPAAGCLGRDLHWHQVLEPLLDEIDQGYHELLAHGPAALVDAYRSDSIVLNHQVRIWPEGTTDLAGTPPLAEGRVTAIDDDLALHIEGLPEPIRSGRLALAP